MGCTVDLDFVCFVVLLMQVDLTLLQVQKYGRHKSGDLTNPKPYMVAIVIVQMPFLVADNSDCHIICVTLI